MKKSELNFAILWIVIYCVLQSLANPINKKLGVDYSASAIFCVIQTVILLHFILKNNLHKQYGLCKSDIYAKDFLYYIPLIILATGNLWNGFAINYSPISSICRILCMLCVGFLEEVIFRGLLFSAMAKDNIKSAIIVSSITFGIGHIINIFNGSGMKIVSNICQIIFAIAVGFLLVTIFYRGKSIIACIFFHSMNNILSTFANTDLNLEKRIIHLIILIVLTIVYTLMLTKILSKKQSTNS